MLAMELRPPARAAPAPRAPLRSSAQTRFAPTALKPLALAPLALAPLALVPLARKAKEKQLEAVAEVGLKEVLRFVWPVMLAFLASTLQGLIDSAFVGRCGGALQLAALSPATSFLDGLSYLLSFTAIGTLNVLAAEGSSSSERERLLSRSLAVAGAVGAVAAVAVMIFAPSCVRLCGAREQVVPLARAYVEIRALGLPLDSLFRVANAGLLSVRDSQTGLKIVGLQSLLNGIGDALICPHLGIAGAAITTLLAQLATTLAILGSVRRKGLIKRFVPPSLEDANSFLFFALPVCLTLTLKVASVQFLSVAATAKGVVAAAAHQITKSLLWVFGLLASESLSSTAQAFLPSFLQRRDRRGAKKTLSLLLSLGAVGALLTAGLLQLIARLGGLRVFCDDAQVLAAVPLAPGLCCIMLTPFTFCLEGAHIAATRQRWLSQRLFLITSLVGLALHSMRRATLAQTWMVFVVYLVRLGPVGPQRRLARVIGLGRAKPSSGGKETAACGVGRFGFGRADLADVFASDGVALFYLYGVLPISYHGNTYNIPVTIYFDPPYPQQPPRCFVTPTSGMALKPNHSHVDAGGMIYLPYLSSWSERSSTLPEMVQHMTSSFSSSPPVYSTTTAARPTAEQQAAQSGQGALSGVFNFLGNLTGGQASASPTPVAGPSIGDQGLRTEVTATAVPVQAQPATVVATPVPGARVGWDAARRRVGWAGGRAHGQARMGFARDGLGLIQLPRRNEKEELAKAVTATLKADTFTDPLMSGRDAMAHVTSLEDTWGTRVEVPGRASGLLLERDLLALLRRRADAATGFTAVAAEETKMKDAVQQAAGQKAQLAKMELELRAFLEAEAGLEHDPDAALNSLDADRRQVLDCLSEEMALEELLTALDELLAEKKIAAADFMREVREVSRRQFLCKMMRQKAAKAVAGSETSGLADALPMAHATPLPPAGVAPRAAVAA
ncbi:unnamed protein product [Effrenium voratum]|nr:unnamed protein product [Effrenium voratum]